jgi:hypothetical protein
LGVWGAGLLWVLSAQQQPGLCQKKHQKHHSTYALTRIRSTHHNYAPPKGRGQRRAPYDFIFTPEGINLRKMAEGLSALPEEEGGGATVLTFSYGARRAYYGTRGRGRGRGGAGRWDGWEEEDVPL